MPDYQDTKTKKDDDGKPKLEQKSEQGNQCMFISESSFVGEENIFSQSDARSIVNFFQCLKPKM